MNLKSMNSMTYSCISKHRKMLMGLAILSVIFFHYTSDCISHHYNVKPLIKLYQTYISSCGVDVFLFLSGLGLYYSFKKCPDMKIFLKKRFSRIVIPYLLISGPAWFYKDICVRELSGTQFVKDLLFISFFEDGNRWFWYIIMIIVCYLIFPYVFNYIDSEGSISKLLNIFVIITVFTMMLEIYCHDFYGNIGIALTRFPAFFFGCFAGKASYHNKKIPKEAILFPILAFLLLYIKADSMRIMLRYITGFTGIVLFVCIAIFLEIISETKVFSLLLPIRKIVEWCGDYSLELYLTHVSFRYVLFHLDLPTYRIRYELLLVVISVIVSIIVKYATDFILKHTINKK